MKQHLVGAILFAIVGMTVEVFFTGLQRGPSRNFMGGVSLLMAILYCVVYWSSAPIFRWMYRIKLRNRCARAFFLVFVIYAFEWSFGALCRVVGFVPWDYTGHGWATDFSQGNITLYLAPFWYIYGLFVEQVIVSIRKMIASLDEEGLLRWKGFWNLRGTEEVNKTS